MADTRLLFPFSADLELVSFLQQKAIDPPTQAGTAPTVESVKSILEAADWPFQEEGSQGTWFAQFGSRDDRCPPISGLHIGAAGTIAFRLGQVYGAWSTAVTRRGAQMSKSAHRLGGPVRAEHPEPPMHLRSECRTGTASHPFDTPPEPDETAEHDPPAG